jgi:BMFP domain-containing protein YqiC
MADMLARARDEQEGLVVRLASLEERIAFIEAGRVGNPSAVHGDQTRD